MRGTWSVSVGRYCPSEDAVACQREPGRCLFLPAVCEGSRVEVWVSQARKCNAPCNAFFSWSRFEWVFTWSECTW